MKILTITPAYGRDYDSAPAAIADFEKGRDFIVVDLFSSPSANGRYVNINDLKDFRARGKYQQIKIRYKSLKRVAIHNL